MFPTQTHLKLFVIRADKVKVLKHVNNLKCQMLLILMLLAHLSNLT